MLNLWRLHMLQQLEALGTMSAVAEALSLTRPAVSQQISRLEREAGTALIQRQGRNVRLTPSGSRLADYANRLLEIEAAAQAELAGMRKGTAGTLRLATFGSAAAGLVPELFRELHSRYPNVELGFSEMMPTESLQAVAARQIDIAIVDDFTMPSTPISATVELRPLFQDTLYLVLPTAHPLASTGRGDLDGLGDELWALNPEATGYHARVMAAIRSAGVEPRLIAGSRGFFSNLELVAAGVAVTIQPGLALIRPDDRLALRPVCPRLERQLYVATMRGTAAEPVRAVTLQALKRAVQRMEASKATPQQSGTNLG